jgi:hypothetical protein
MVGFCTEKGLGCINSFANADSVYFHCHDKGSLREGGSCKQINEEVEEGDLIECVADLPNRKFSWWRNATKFLECRLPTEMKNQVIFISILLCNSGDEVDLCV